MTDNGNRLAELGMNQASSATQVFSCTWQEPAIWRFSD